MGGVGAYISYVLVSNKLPQTLQLTHIYDLTFSVGQESGHDLTGCSASGSPTGSNHESSISHHVLFVRSKSWVLPIFIDRTFTQGHECQEVGLTGGHLRVCLPLILREHSSTPGLQQK